MEYLPLWCKDLTLCTSTRKEAFLSSLSSVKLRVTAQEKEAGFGIILLDSPDKLDEALAVVKSLSLSQKQNIVILFDEGLCRSCVVWEFLFAGASKVYDFENTPLLHQAIQEQVSRWHTIEGLMKTAFVKEYLVGESPVWKNAVREMIEVAVYSQSSVLIIGESGTGKEMLSKLIHHFDTRKTKGDLVLVDCSTIAPELSGSEFFGHEKGAFTGAHSTREGAFSLANEGTLFLDEIGELPARLQSELLRVIQEGMYKPVGGNLWKKTHFRLVGATNRTLTDEVKLGRFRLDLYYRLSAWVCKVPSLTERKEDIPLLAERFLTHFFGKKETPKMEESVIEYLINRHYNGNVRELQQVVYRIANRHVGRSPITLSDIPAIDRPEHKMMPAIGQETNNGDNAAYEQAIQAILDKGCNLDDIKKLTSQIAIDLAIRRENGSIIRAAERLGITTRTIQYNKQK